jgi:hypothetical protein
MTGDVMYARVSCFAEPLLVWLVRSSHDGIAVESALPPDVRQAALPRRKQRFFTLGYAALVLNVFNVK